jgi:hypothetical protein
VSTASTAAPNVRVPPKNGPTEKLTVYSVERSARPCRTRLGGALEQIARRGGGLVEAIPEVTAGRDAHGRFLYSATVELFEDHGFERVRQVGKHAWIVSKFVRPRGR